MIDDTQAKNKINPNTFFFDKWVLKDLSQGCRNGSEIGVAGHRANVGHHKMKSFRK